MAHPLVADMCQLIVESRRQAAAAVNLALTLLYSVEMLELRDAGIHVAEYLTVLPAKDVLERKLHEAIAAARLRFESKEGQA